MKQILGFVRPEQGANASVIQSGVCPHLMVAVRKAPSSAPGLLYFTYRSVLSDRGDNQAEKQEASLLLTDLHLRTSQGIAAW
jgi:hypothetical protein|nr:hypothetical protein GCM10020185_32780 [Pseudomonas brassicacearum subsp. brassicacearum]